VAADGSLSGSNASTARPNQNRVVAAWKDTQKLEASEVVLASSQYECQWA